MPAPVKQPINISFANGLNLKPDPYQVPVGNFLSLVNTVFDKVSRLTKRNGFPFLTTLPNDTTSYLTTFNNDLQAIGTDVLAFSSGQNSWIDKGSIYPVSLSVMPLIRNSFQQTQADVAIAPNGLQCTVYTENNGSANTFKYLITDSVTGQSITNAQLLPGADATYGTPRVFLVGLYFVILYTTHPGSTYELVYLAIPYNNVSVTLTDVISTNVTPATTVAFDAILVNGNALMIAYNSNGGGVKAISLSSNLALSVTVTVDPAHSGTIFSMAVDDNLLHVWITYFSGSTGYTAIISNTLTPVLPPTLVIPSGVILNIASIADSGTLTFFYEVANNYGYDSSIPTHFIEGNTLTSSGTLGTAFTSVRSLGLASKAFELDGIIYYLAAYQSPIQDTYFLIDGSTSRSSAPITVAKLAYSNGGGYVPTGLPNAILTGTVAQIPYRRKDFLETQANPGNQTIQIPPPTIYTHTGINIASFNISTTGLAATEMGSNLNLSGGFLWGYDGFLPVEQNFFLFPDSVEGTWSATGGFILAQPDGMTNTNAYYGMVIYQWTDSQGNLFRSAPSVPTAVTTTGTGNSGTITWNIPTLRLTYKIPTPVNILVYRWSIENQVYYQVTSIQQPLQNDTTIDYITFVDTTPDTSVVGGNIVYTTGGVLEDTNGPASNILTLFDDRLWLVDAEDSNLLWYSKQVIENTPVEMSELLTFFIAPSIGAQGSTGKITALAPLDDKLILFKRDAMYFINGTGPDNTGANNQYSQPIFITGTVGCSNPRSIVLTPNGLMFQSDKGVWLLNRELQTSYIGAPVEDFNTDTVTSAVAAPGTNQVRFGLDSGVTLMYDYYVGQWGTFEGIPSISATLYNNLHTVVNQYGQVSQELEGTYIDGNDPVLMSFSTSWLQLSGLRGYMRAYWFYLLGTFLSPHKLNVSVAYDYNSSPVQTDLISPTNYEGPYGADTYFGGDGSSGFGMAPQEGSIEQFRIFLARERCKAFQVNVQEVFDPTYGTVAGPGLTLSGLNCIVGVKRPYAPVSQNYQVG